MQATLTSTAPTVHPSHASHATTPQPAQLQETASDYRPPSLAERMPQAIAIGMPAIPPTSAVFRPLASTPPQLQAAADILNLPSDLLDRLIPFLRPDNTIPSIRDVARFRSACKHFHKSIMQPIPDGVMGAIEFNRVDGLKKLLLELQQSGEDVAQHLNCEGPLLTIPEARNCTELPLAAAAFLGHVEMISALIAAGAEVNQMNSRKFTALMLAVAKDDGAIVHALVQAGAEVDQSESSGVTALTIAAVNGNAIIVKALLQAGAKVDQTGIREKTALMLAAKNGNTATVEALLQSGARVDHGDQLGKTALIVAANNGHTAIVKMLLQAGAQVDKAMVLGVTALLCAAEKGNAATVEALLQAGAKCNLEFALSEATKLKHDEIIKLLLEYGVDSSRVHEDWYARFRSD